MPERKPVQGAAEEKASRVHEMFSAIAARYDLMNHLMTGGRDVAWRRLAARLACLPTEGRVLDVAAGTADLSLALARQYPTATVIALDFNLPMLKLGKEKTRRAAQERMAFLAGDALRLPFHSAVFDAVTSGFMMRNVADVVQAFAEMRRVVRPGGRVICLELTQPRLPVFRELFWWYFTRLVPRMGSMISKNGEAYTYLPHSLEEFMPAEELKAKMELAGLCQVSYRRLMMGTVAIHVGRRP